MKRMRIICGLVFLSSMVWASEDVDMPSVSDVPCSERMTQLLSEHPEAVIVHVKGLVCSSCGIGIKIGIRKIEGVDLSLFDRGVELDSSNQYVLVGQQSAIDFNALFQAIYKAGYDPLHLCYIDQGKVVRIEAPQLR